MGALLDAQPSSDKQRFRLLISLGRKVTPDECEPIGRRIAQRIDIKSMDPTIYEASRFMYWPSKSRDGEYVKEISKDGLLDVVAQSETVAHQRKIKKMVDPWKKTASLATSARRTPSQKPSRNSCRQVYTPCDVPNRYTYTAGSTTGGVIIYDNDLHAYSHHATDPISGQDVNAFDLVLFNLFISSHVAGMPQNR